MNQTLRGCANYQRSLDSVFALEEKFEPVVDETRQENFPKKIRHSIERRIFLFSDELGDAFDVRGEREHVDGLNFFRAPAEIAEDF